MRKSLAVLAVLAVAGSVIHAAAVEPRATRNRVEHGPTATRYLIGAAGDIACQDEAYGPGSPANCQYDEIGRASCRERVSSVV